MGNFDLENIARQVESLGNASLPAIGMAAALGATAIGAEISRASPAPGIERLVVSSEMQVPVPGGFSDKDWAQLMASLGYSQAKHIPTRQLVVAASDSELIAGEYIPRSGYFWVTDRVSLEEARTVNGNGSLDTGTASGDLKVSPKGSLVAWTLPSGEAMIASPMPSGRLQRLGSLKLGSHTVVEELGDDPGLVLVSDGAKDAAEKKYKLFEFQNGRRLSEVELTPVTLPGRYISSFDAGSAYDSEALGGYGPSDNMPRPWHAADSLAKDSLVLKVEAPGQVIKEYDWDAGGDLYILGQTVHLINTHPKQMTFDAVNSSLSMYREARDPKSGEWVQVERIPESWCGNSYHRVFLPAGEAWSFKIPCWEGDTATDLRVVLDLGKTKVYSEPFRGRVNSAQFGRDLEHQPSGVMDSMR